MKVLICGSRDIEKGDAIRRRIIDLQSTYDDLFIITGTKRDEKRAVNDLPQFGVDRIAHDVCIRLGIPHKVIEAEWTRLGRRAGPTRNRLMLDEKPDLVVAFWDGKSRGTDDTMTEAKRRSIPVEMIRMLLPRIA